MTDQKLADSQQRWDVVITPKRGWFDIDISGVWQYRNLILILFKRDFISLYKQTILGPLWYMIQPLMLTLIYTVVFFRIARIATDEVPPFLFYMAGIVLWSFFSTCITKTADTFTANSGIFSKVYFPRLVVPVAGIMSNYLTFVIQFSMFTLYLIYYWVTGSLEVFGWEVLLIIPLIVYLSLVGLGIGIIISSLTIRWRDLSYAMSFILQLWMYMSPVVYPISFISEEWQWVFIFNPMAAPVETFRWIVLGAGTVTPAMWMASISFAMLVITAGLMLFGRAEKLSMDTV